MEYMALSTYGAYLPKVIESDVRQYVYIMNIYHEAFLCWGFKKALQGKVQRFFKNLDGLLWRFEFSRLFILNQESVVWQFLFLDLST